MEHAHCLAGISRNLGKVKMEGRIGIPAHFLVVRVWTGEHSPAAQALGVRREDSRTISSERTITVLV